MAAVWTLICFKMPVSYVGLLSDFCGMHSKPVPTSSSFSLVSTLHFSAGFLSTSDPTDLSLLISLWVFVCLEAQVQEIYNKISS
jgi:hypothetical protein